MPIAVASTSSAWHIAKSSSRCLGGTANTIRSWASDPDLGVRQSFVFQRHSIKPDFRAQFLAHLAHRAGQPTGSAIGHRRVKTAISRAFSITSINIFSVIALPICTAAGDFIALGVNSAELNVAP